MAWPPRHQEEFLGDARNVAAAESFFRRALEAVFDIGRHLLSKSGHNDLAREYKSIARGLGSLGIVPEQFVTTLTQIAGYRNRLVHLYHEVIPEELYQIIIARRDHLRQFVAYISKHLRDA
jgi:uncharacterized protein YutE (UPF0331/DUF86 family)